MSTSTKDERQLTGKRLGLFGGDGAQMAQIALVTNEHDDYVAVGMVTELFQPALDVLVRQVLCNVVYKQRAHSPAVVCARDSTIALLAGWRDGKRMVGATRG